ncbi:peptidase family M1, partial [Ostertagia ostertagi]
DKPSFLKEVPKTPTPQLSEEGSSTIKPLPIGERSSTTESPPPDKGSKTTKPPPPGGTSSATEPTPPDEDSKIQAVKILGSYNLSVKPYLPLYESVPTERPMTFDGEVEIRANTNERVDEIELNMLDIEIIEERCAVIVDNRSINIRNISVSREYQKVVFSMDEFIEKDEELKIKIGYTGAIIEGMLGFYGFVYTDSNGSIKVGATTQFEQAHARKMVPCFDEPSFKAPWSVTVIHPQGTTALSNGIEFRVWSQPQRINETSYALDFGVKCLEFFEDFLEIKYPLDKLDFVALPRFRAGGMENWGLNNYKYVSFLWFGNLVTMRWWSELWLKEGFSDFMAFLALEKITDRGRAEADYFLTSSLEVAFMADAGSSTHPLKWHAEKPSELMDGVSAISYKKGASFLVMTAAILGADDFYKGVKIGFPLITVRSINDSTFEISQERYKKDPTEADPPKYNSSGHNFQWDVPLWYQLNHEPVKLTWLRAIDGPLYISADTVNTTIVVNADRYGFYRQNYDVEGWKKIAKQLLEDHTVPDFS